MPFFKLRKQPAVQGALYDAVHDAMVDVQAYAKSHGGRIELVEVSDDGTVTIRFHGACKHCPISALTLRFGVEENLRKLVPGVRKVVQA